MQTSLLNGSSKKKIRISFEPFEITLALNAEEQDALNVADALYDYDYFAGLIAERVAEEFEKWFVIRDMVEVE